LSLVSMGMDALESWEKTTLGVDQIHSNAIVYSLRFYYHYFCLISCMTKMAYSLTLLLVGLCTVSAAFMKCSPVYQPHTSVGLLYYHRRFCLKHKITSNSCTQSQVKAY
jgi:hypothetical protein